MNTAQLISNVYLLQEGERPTFSEGSSDWNAILDTANLKIDEWMTEADWASLYDPYHQVAIVSSTDTFSLPSDARKLSDAAGDFVVIECLDGTVSEYEVVRPEELKRYRGGKVCAKSGRSIRFTRPFNTEDKEFGGNIKAPVYLYASHLLTGTDPTPVDDPNWLVKATAAERVRVDIVNSYQYSNLISEANALMTNMKRDNEAQLQHIYNSFRAGGRSW